MASGSDKDTYKVTMEDINKVTKELGPDELRHLYDNLGIPPHKVEHAEASAGTTDTILKAREVLRWWRREKGSSFTQEALFGERDKILKSRTAETEPGEFNLKQCQDQLRKLYLGPEMQVQLTPWLGDDDTREMEAIFVNLEMEKDKDKHSQVEHKQLKSNEDLMDLHYTDTGLRVNRILIQGDAGSGKSTLLNNIAYKWAKLKNTDSSESSDSPLSQFELVFLINLYEIDTEHKNDSLEEIIFDQLLENDSNVFQTSLKSYLELASNSERCLFLVDGIDEHSVAILNSTTSEMSKLIYYNKIHRNSCVIASTRPDTLKNIGRNNKLHIFMKVNLTGFSDENIEEYIRKHFGTNDINQYEGLVRQLQELQNVWDLAGIPLLLMLFCVLWDDPDQANRSLPNTRTKLYQDAITSLWKRYHNNRYDISGERDSSEEGEESQIGLNKFLEALGKETLKGLLDPSQEKILFKANEFDKTTLSLALGVGILSRKKIKSKLHKISHIKFLHTSIQDYCSGLYLANLYFTSNDEFKKCTKKMCLWGFTIYVHWFHRIFGAMHFCVGCKPETSRLLTNQYFGAFELIRHTRQGMSQESTEYKCLSKEFLSFVDNIWSIFYSYSKKKGQHSLGITFPLELSYEAQLTYEECASLVDIAVRQSDLQGKQLHLGFQQYLQSKTVKSLQYQLNLLKPVTDTNNGLFFSTLTEIQVLDPIEFPKLYPLFVSMLMYTKQLSGLFLAFEIVPTPKHLNQVCYFAEMFDALADLKAFKTLVLQRCDESCHHLDISQSLKKVPHLLELELKLFWKLQSSVFFMPHLFGSDVSLIKVVSHMKNLLQLDLGFVITWRAVKCLEPIISQLNSLNLIYPMDDGLGIYEFTSYLQKAKALNELQLCGRSLKISICSLSDQLKHMVNLKKLALYVAKLGDQEVKILVDGIKTMATLDKLDLRHNPDIGLLGYNELQSLCLLPQFQQLKIELDPLSFEMLQRQKVLDSLYSLPALPDYKSCMSQLYCSIKCAQCSRGDRGKDLQDEEVAASSIPTSSKQTEPRAKDWKHKFSSSADETTDDNGQSAKRELATNLALNNPKTETSESSGLPVQKCNLQEQLSPEIPLQKQTTCCFNPEYSKPETEIPGGLKRCSRCKTISYCSRDCQRKHWKIHQFTCGKDFIQEESLSTESVIHEPVQHCFNPECSKPKTEVPGSLKRCTQCKTVSYCSRDCQRKHWKIHRSSCGKDQIQEESLSTESIIQESVQRYFNPECSKPKTEVPGSLKRCTRCKTVSYCSKDYQRKHWKIHRSTCGKDPVKELSLSTESLMQKSIQYCFNTECSKPEIEVLGGLKRCTRCKTVSYCSRDCQRKHWKIHQSTCGKDPVQEESLSTESPIPEPVMCCFNPKCSKPEIEVPGGLKRCTRCKTVSYCNRDCQRKHWKIHRATCGKEPVQDEILSTKLTIQKPVQHCSNPECSKPETEIPGGLKTCTRCKTVSYCSKDCQRKHWKIHRSACGQGVSPPVESALRETTHACFNPVCSKPESDVSGGLKRCTWCKTVS